MDEFQIVFSNHAWQQLHDRHIPVDWVKLTVSAPQKILLFGNKFFAYRQFSKLYLKVVFVRDKDEVVVVTQHFVKKLPL